MSIKRLNYFNHQFLDERDFRDEQSYHIAMRRERNRMLHLGGVVEGLQVERSGHREVTIQKGFALDREGRELIVSHPLTREVTAAEHHERAYIPSATKSCWRRPTAMGPEAWKATTGPPKPSRFTLHTKPRRTAPVSSWLTSTSIRRATCRSHRGRRIGNLAGGGAV